MNTAQAREIPIEKVLQNLGCEPTKTNEKESWYLSPFRVEKSASFKINRKINRWFDHGEQKGGNAIDFVVLQFGFSISEALEYLSKFETFFFFQKQISQTNDIKNENSPTIIKTIPIQHSALIQYLNQRGITKFRSIKQLKEIHYSIQEKKYFALGFENNSGGFEVRNKYAKLCLNKKDSTTILNNGTKICVFEGFFDFLSFYVFANLTIEKTDYLILNSVALLSKNLSLLANYNGIELYLDNDETGDKYTSSILNQFSTAQDCRTMYKGFKDLNEYHIAVGMNDSFI
jgi:DNA primase